MFGIALKQMAGAARVGAVRPAFVARQGLVARCFSDEAGLAGQQRGRVKWFNARKGFGFIVPEAQSSSPAVDIFVHYSSIEQDDGGFRSLYDNEEVEFELSQEEGGRKQASRVRRLNAPVPEQHY